MRAFSRRQVRRALIYIHECGKSHRKSVGRSNWLSRPKSSCKIWKLQNDFHAGRDHKTELIWDPSAYLASESYWISWDCQQKTDLSIPQIKLNKILLSDRSRRNSLRRKSRNFIRWKVNNIEFPKLNASNNRFIVEAIFLLLHWG